MNLDTAIQEAIDESLGMWRYRWHALALAWLIALGGWLWALQLPNEWEAKARVYVDTDSLLDPLMQGLAVKQDAYDKITLMSRALLSRPQLQKVALETGLQVRAPTPEEFDKLLDSLETRINFKETSQQKLFAITFRDTDPIMARAVVNSLLNRFMDESFGENATESKSAQEFIERQIEENELRLIEAENRLAEFKKRNVSMMPGSDGDYFQRLQGAENNVRMLRAELEQVELRRAELLRQIEGEEPTFGIMIPPDGQNTGDVNDMDSISSPEIAEIERALRNRLLTVTEKHPDVIRMKEQIAELKRKRMEELSSGTGSTTSQPTFQPQGPGGEFNVDENPVYQHMRIELSQSEVQLVGLRAALAEEEKRVEYLSQMVDTIPEVEAELIRLNRDYGVVKAQYDSLLSRLESARLAEDIQQDTKDVTFRIIDPPYVPFQPSGPNRLPLLAATLIAAIGAAAALSYFLSQQNPVYFSARSLRNRTGLPIFGVVGITESGRKSRGGYLFMAGLAGLVFTWLLMVVTEQKLIELLDLISTST